MSIIQSNQTLPNHPKVKRKMKIVKKNVYYCDHCKKRLLAAFAMNKHEKHCTNNPNRECRLCEIGPNIGEIVKEINSSYEIVDSADIFTKTEVKWLKEPITMNWILDQVDDCPLCAFSVLRQTELYLNFFPSEFSNYDWKTESKKRYQEKHIRD